MCSLIRVFAASVQKKGQFIIYECSRNCGLIQKPGKLILRMTLEGLHGKIHMTFLHVKKDDRPALIKCSLFSRAESLSHSQHFFSHAGKVFLG